MNEPLPIDDALPALRAALIQDGAAVLHAPPGAGKTTRVPLALLEEPWLLDGRIVMLEPRRLAARAAAAFMARLLGEHVGQTVGHRMRLDTRVSARTRVEVVTEGVLTRMLQHDPALENVALVIFDEFHERSLHADVGLALTLQSRALLRPELRLLVMSATIEADPVARLLGNAPIIRSAGRAWPVETVFRQSPVKSHIEPAVIRTIAHAIQREPGDVLVFLPGAAEIRRTESGLRAMALPDVDIYPLYGQLPQDVQDRALAQSQTGRRKVVLATSIAETSLTIEGVRIVVDSGLMRSPRFSPRSGMSRLETTRVTRASADQRRGRAGRVAPGLCFRLWTAAEDAALLPQRTPEIREADLAPLALDLAIWGTVNPDELEWLDPPPPGAYAQARALLTALDATHDDGSISEHGRALAAIPAHPRIAHMLVRAAELHAAGDACSIAALIAERDIFRGDGAREPDLQPRIDALRGRREQRADPQMLDHVRREAQQLERRLKLHSVGEHKPQAGVAASSGFSTGALLALAYPDRVAQRRPGPPGRLLLRNGRGARIDPLSALAAAEFVVAAVTDDAGAEARVQLGAAIDRAEVELIFAGDISTETTIEWDDTADAGRAYRTRSLGAIVLERVRVDTADSDRLHALLISAIRRKGIAALPWTEDTTALRHRLAFAHHHDPASWPDARDTALLRDVDTWLLPFVPDARALTDIRAADLAAALHALLGHARMQALDAFAPSHFLAPSGSRIPIDYSNPDAPVLAVKLQELFGLADTPRIAGGRLPLLLHLLSPARRPVQVTSDLAGFWARSYFDVRKDLRGRYPRHPWPDDPLSAPATRGLKPR